jgi:outer membrane protein
MFDNKSSTLFCSMILAVMAGLLSSCVLPNLEPRSDYVAPEAREDLPGSQQESDLQEPADPNDIVAAKGPLKIGIENAILLAMENNQSLLLERMNPEISRTFEAEELSAFDPSLNLEVSPRRYVSDRLSRAGSGIETSTVDSLAGQVSLDTFFPTGTTVELQAGTNYTDSSLYSDTFAANRLGFTVTQALLRGMGVRANLARVNQARLDTLISQYELRGFTEILLEEVESKFWDYALAKRQIEIYTDSLKLAEKQMAEAEERIRIGKLGRTELAAAQAEVALRQENLINARSNLARERLNLLRLLSPSGDIDWDRDIVLEYEAALPSVELDSVEQHVQVALKMRSDLNQARLQIEQGRLEVVRTRNGLLPKMDVFVTFGKTGYADTFDKAVNQVDGQSYDVTLGLGVEVSPINRSARAEYSRAVISRLQLLRALKNLVQLVQVDVRSAYIEVIRAREQIAATAATRNFQEEKLRAETEKFRVGRSTSLLVAQAQRDLVVSQIAEIEVIANYLKSLVTLYRLEGSLLQRRGISVPGTEAIVLEGEN